MRREGVEMVYLRISSGEMFRSVREDLVEHLLMRRMAVEGQKVAIGPESQP